MMITIPIENTNYVVRITASYDKRQFNVIFNATAKLENTMSGKYQHFDVRFKGFVEDKESERIFLEITEGGQTFTSEAVNKGPWLIPRHFVGFYPVFNFPGGYMSEQYLENEKKIAKLKDNLQFYVEIKEA